MDEVADSSSVEPTIFLSTLWLEKQKNKQNTGLAQKGRDMKPVDLSGLIKGLLVVIGLNFKAVATDVGIPYSFSWDS